MENLPEIVNLNPAHIWIEPTTRCNTRCKYCLHWYDKFGEDMPYEIYAKIRSHVLDHVKRAELIGYGEPFIAQFFWEMFDDCVKRDIEIFTTTNGLPLLNEEILPKIVRNRIVICLSLDGARKETAEFARPFIKLEQMIHLLELLKRYGEEAGREKRFSLRFNIVAMKNNIGDLPDMVRLGAKYGATEIFIMTLGAEEDRDLVRGQGLFDSPELVSKAFIKALKLGLQYGVNVYVPGAFRTLILEGREKRKGLSGRLQYMRRMAILSFISLRKDGLKHSWERAKKWFGPRDSFRINSCFMPWHDAYFAADSSVFPCCVMGQKMGSMQTQDWPEIWNGSPYRNLRRTIHSWNPSMVCRYCGLSVGITGGDDKYYNKFFGKYRKEDVPLNSPALVFGHGFYQLENDPAGNPSHIWMGRKGRFSMPRPRGAEFLRIRIIPRSPQNTLNSGFCIINSGAREYFDNTCEDLHFPLKQVRGDQLDVSLEMENEYQVGEDPRHLALPIKGIQFLFSTGVLK